MPFFSRRSLLAGAGAGIAGVGLGATVEPTTASAATLPADAGTAGVANITPDDSRYQDLLLRGYNRRGTFHPDSFRVVRSTAQVVQAVNDAVRTGKQIAVRSGGHCLELIVDIPEVKVVIDFTEMRAVDFDPARNAFVVEAGATLGEVYRRLDYGWGVTLPGGVCPTVGAGGHIIGGGFGVLSRQYGLISDHLHAVEVVVVGADRVARAVVATREANDPNNGLWWAHTGGGGGNFGVVTRFWLRSPGSKGTDPTRLLPRVPGGVQVGRAVWNWSDLTKDAFIQIARNFGTWMEQNSSPTSPGRALHANLAASRIEAGKVTVVGQVDPTVAGNGAILDGFLNAVGAGVPITPQIVRTAQLPWLSTTIKVPDSAVALGVQGPPRWKSNVSVLRKRYTDQQIATAYDYQTRSGYRNTASTFALTSYGGQINALATGDTATPHRAAIMFAAVSTVWDDPATDDANLTWARTFFRDLYAATGGVPVLDEQTDGCPINWPNVDLLGAPWNTSPVSAHTLFHGSNYSRLQQIKKKWDPRNIFRHPLSVELPR
ncbi:FAD-binding oxidoreductase [Frankia sp. CiP3]|uniref:FAD-binding oxidoreductase n=1 Tax=Frankia sp. CiP3 TaxID=2880971 RepID=UPI001EF437DA|nr:FAD-binding protein [Frankia sp. CiP3]